MTFQKTFIEKKLADITEYKKELESILNDFSDFEKYQKHIHKHLSNK